MVEIRENPETSALKLLIPSSCSNGALNWAHDMGNAKSPSQNPNATATLASDFDDDAVSFDSILCVSGSRFVRNGFVKTKETEKIVKFVNTGGGAMERVGDSSILIMADCAFVGGTVLTTDDKIVNGGDFSPLYQSARFGNFCYRFNNLPAGDYLVDLHFVEMINTNGPKGLRVFDVYMQDEKVVSELDIYLVVGANKPLQLVDVRVTVGNDGVVLIRFEGVNGVPVVSGICIKEETNLHGSHLEQDCLICDNCTAEIKVTSAQIKHMRMRSTAKYEKKIEELSTQYQLKTNECYEAWMSLTAANKQLEKVMMELDNKTFQNHYLDQAMNTQSTKLRDVCSRYEYYKGNWESAINELRRKVKIMKEEHYQLSREAHENADSIPELNKMVFAIQALVTQCEDLKLKVSQEKLKSKKLYNQIQEAKGNIRVFCRCRPLSNKEVSSGCATVVDFDAANDGDLGILTGVSTKKIYKFDRVYSPKENQVDVFTDASPVVVSVLDGYNVCIFAYGQTGTGKTFTMEGTEQNRGVNYRTLEKLFELAEERKDTSTYKISVSVLEVYNEQIRDLLAISPTSKKLEVKQSSEGVHHVPGIVEAKVQNIKEAWGVLQAGNNARAVGSNNVNDYSSRSHCMLCIMVRAKNLMNGECTSSKLWLVDLAGSERLAKTEAQGDRLKEAQNINRSLSALGDVISALASKSNHIPYRNSKLTHLLQDSLGGDSKTLMFVQISPSEQDTGETLSSLNFATRVRGIELGPAKKNVDTGEIQKLRLLLDKAKQESSSKDEILMKLQENLQNSDLKSKSKDQVCKYQQEKLDELGTHLDTKTELCKHLEKKVSQLSGIVNEKEEICSSLQQKVNALENKLEERENMDSKTLQQKVKEVENKLKVRTEEFELQSVVLQEKIKDLEEKLRRQNPEQEGEPPSTCLPDNLFTTPHERKSWFTSETKIGGTDQRGLRSLKPSNNRQESVLLKGADSLCELRRKQRDHHLQSKGIENNMLLSSAPLVEKKSLPAAEGIRVRSGMDPSKAFARVTRTTTKPFHGPQKLYSSSKVTRQVVPVNKERDNSTRVWSR